jgi:hypothetical protein
MVAVLCLAIGILLIIMMPIAILDEFARFPFYMSIPLAAVMLNGFVLINVLRHKVLGRTKPFVLALHGTPPIPPAVPLKNSRNGIAASGDEIRSAFDKLHAVVWECAAVDRHATMERENA